MARDDIPFIKLRFDHETCSFKKTTKMEPFLKGPIKLSWLSKAANLPGKSLNVALAIRWIAGMNQRGPIKLTGGALQLFNVSRNAVYDALTRLEAAGLIKRTQMPGQRASIEIVEA